MARIQTFCTLAIEKRSSEVWKTLASVKTEFATFGKLLDKAKRNLDLATKDIETLQGTRTRAINRTLRNVEALPIEEVKGLIPDEEFLEEANDGNE